MSSTPITPQARGPAPVQAARNRQIVYALGIVVIFGLLFPYTEKLNELKRKADLGEATIGLIDGGNFLQKLAMISGFRGIVVNTLWMQAQEFQRQHEWDKLNAAVDMIIKLQPHFLSIWTFQGWNLAYNVSVEWDAPEDKYDWIKKGILFLRQGVLKNQKRPDLMWDTAWTYYHKIGFADEAILLRRLFYDDEDRDGQRFKVDPNTGNVVDDNFLAAKGWFVRAVKLVDEGAQRLEAGTSADVKYVDRAKDRKARPDDLNFRAHPAYAQTRYAMGLEKMSKHDIEPTFGQVAQSEWNQAYLDWLEFGRYPFPAHNNRDEPILIDDVSNPERFAKELSDNQRYWTNRWADQMNYRYWKDRADAEREPQAVEARRLIYEATRAFRRGNSGEATRKFREGLVLLRELMERHPIYRDDDFNRKDTGEVVRRYVIALRQNGDLAPGQGPPEGTPFGDLYELVKNEKFNDPFDQLDAMPEDSMGDRATGPTGSASPRTPQASPNPAPAPAPGADPANPAPAPSTP